MKSRSSIKTLDGPSIFMDPRKGSMSGITPRVVPPSLFLKWEYP